MDLLQAAGVPWHGRWIDGRGIHRNHRQNSNRTSLDGELPK